MGVERESAAELGDIGVAVGKQLAGRFGGTGFTAAGGGQGGGGGIFGAVESLPNAAEIDLDGAAVGEEAPGLFVVFGG